VGGGEAAALAPFDVSPAEMDAEQVRSDDDRDRPEWIAFLDRRDFLEQFRFEGRKGSEEEAMRARVSPGGHDEASLR
jgi:hypothetical protein